jgi:hypothetical protein
MCRNAKAYPNTSVGFGAYPTIIKAIYVTFEIKAFAAAMLRRNRKYAIA